MGYRTEDKQLMTNEMDFYKSSSLFKNRRVKRIVQFSTSSMKYPTQRQMSRFIVVKRIWKVGDKFYKLANEYYGDPEMWWVIPWFNKKSLESDFTIGDIIYIPTPLEEVLEFLEE